MDAESQQVEELKAEIERLTRELREEREAFPSPDWQKIAKELGTSDKERLAIWMIQHGFATGHGDNLDDLLHEMAWQVAELRMDSGKKKALITELCDALESIEATQHWDWTVKLLQRAREATPK